MMSPVRCLLSTTSSRLLQMLVLVATFTKLVDSQQNLTLQFDMEVLQNNSIFDIDLIGEDMSSSIQCLTSRDDCCDSISTGSVGTADWFSPSGEELNSLRNTREGLDFYRDRNFGGIDLRRRGNATMPEGVYRCEIPKRGTSGDVDVAYIGLYVTGNGSPAITSFTADIPAFTLTCTSSGGPATTVTWTRDDVTLDTSSSDFSFTQVLLDSSTAEYANTLMASRRDLLPGNFTCTVSNLAGNAAMSLEVTMEESLATSPPPPVTTESPIVASGVYLSFNQIPRPNNSIISLEDISETVPVLCITENTASCCDFGNIENQHWNYPNGSLVQQRNLGRSFYQSWIPGHVRLHRHPNTGVSPTFPGGVFECSIIDSENQRVFLYVGIYPEGQGSPEIFGFNFNGTTFSLTCISTGGVASEVSWFVNNTALSESTHTYRTSQLVADPETSTYYNILEGVSVGSLLGIFTCVVENEIGRADSTVELDANHPPAPVIVNAPLTPSQGFFSVDLQWNQPDNRFVREYRLTFAYVGPCPEGVVEGEENVTVLSGLVTRHVIEGLYPNAEYSGTLVAINDRGSSNVISFTVSTPTTAPSGQVQSWIAMPTTTAITLSWERVSCLERNGNITGYHLTWSSPYHATDMTITVAGVEDRSITLRPLIPGTNHTIQLVAVNSEGQRGPVLDLAVLTPRVSELVLQLNGVQYPNNSIVNPSDIGTNEAALFCLTNNPYCCSGSELDTRRNWVDTSTNTDVPQRSVSEEQNLEFFNNRGQGTVRLNRRLSGQSSFPGGVFKCIIPDINNVSQELYIGIYPPEFGVPAIATLTYDPVTTTLTCVSTSGPATVVSWYQDQASLRDNGESILESQIIVSSQADIYNNMLQLRRSNEVDNLGTYRCFVSNNRGNVSAELTVRESKITSDVFRLGSPAVINCSDTRGDVNLNNVLEWLNDTGEVVSMATNASVLEMRFEAADFAVNGSVFACRVADHVTTSVTIQVLDSGPPEALMNSEFQFTWQPPRDALTSFFSYQLTCEPLLLGLPTLMNTTGAGVLSARLEDLEDGNTYSCAVRATRGEYTSQPATLMVTRPDTRPTAFPPLFRVHTNGSREISFEFQDVPLLDRNGLILDYTVSCNASAFRVAVGRFLSAGVVTVVGFRPDTQYDCVVAASNMAGTGPRSPTISVTSNIEKFLFQVELSRVDRCLAWVGSQSTEKADSIKSSLMTRINDNCQECQIMDDNIRNGQLLCFDSSPQTVTYRAEVHGSQDSTAEEILNVIDTLVSLGESIRVLSVTMNLVSSCEVRIDSFDEEKCEVSTGGTRTGDSGGIPLIPVIVGGALGGVVLLAVCCIAVVAVVLVRQRRRKKASRLHNNLNEGPSEGLYSSIPPQLPPDRRRGNSANGKSGLEEECTSFQNRSFHIGSTSSLRYVPSVNPAPLPTASDGVYAEIDGEERRKNPGLQRRPSGYEKVLIRDKETGKEEFVDTEDSHPLSPSRSATSSLQRGGGVAGEEGEEFQGKVDLSNMIPALHPQASENQYELIPNKGFQSHENSPPVETERPNLTPNHSSGAEIVQNEGYSESVELTRSRNFSVSNNPMYSTSSVHNKAKKVLAVGNADSQSVKNPHFVEYDVPKDGVRPKPASTAVVVPDPGNPPQTANLRAWGNNKGVGAPTGGKHSVPSPGKQQMSGEISFPAPESMTANPIYSSYYDVPTKNHKDANTSRDSERSMENQIQPAGKDVSASATYDVPPHDAAEDPLPKHANLVMYDIPPHRSKNSKPAEDSNSHDNDEPRKPHSNFVMIDILPLPGKPTDAERLRPQASSAAYDVPPSRRHEKVGVSTKGSSSSSPFYKYDIPPSAPKLDNS